MSPELLPSLLALLAGILGVAGGWFATRTKYLQFQKELLARQKDLEKQVKDLNAPMVFSFKRLNQLHDLVHKMFEQTNVTRFLILVAVNGQEDFKYATAIYEQHVSNDPTIPEADAQLTSRYIKFEFDSHYKDMLKHIERFGPSYMIVDQMPDSDLKRIYNTEGVKTSKVFFLRRTKIDEENDRLWYASVASHTNEELSENERMIIRTYMGQIKGIINAMD